MANAAFSILSQLQAENLLAGSHILERIAQFNAALGLSSDGENLSLDDYFFRLQADKGKIKHLELETNITHLTGGDYLRRLAGSLEEILDEIEVQHDRVINFQGHLRTAQTDIQDLSTEFDVWYSLAAQEQLKATDIKLPAASVKALATSEFNRLMNRANVGVESLFEALKVLNTQLASKKKFASEKFSLGKEQAYSAYSSRPEDQGHNSEDGEPTKYAQRADPEEDEDEDLPSFLRDRPQVAQAGTYGVIVNPNAATGTVDVHTPAMTFTIPTPTTLTTPVGIGTPVVLEPGGHDALVVAAAVEVAAGVDDADFESPKEPLPVPYDSNCYLETFCHECGERQFTTPTGVLCDLGHPGKVVADTPTPASAEVVLIEEEDSTAIAYTGGIVKLGDPVEATVVTLAQARSQFVFEGDDEEDAPTELPPPAPEVADEEDDLIFAAAEKTPEKPVVATDDKSLAISEAAQAASIGEALDELDALVPAKEPVVIEKPAPVKIRRKLTFELD